MLVFDHRGKPEYPEENLSEQGREATTNSKPSYGVDAGIWTQATSLRGDCSHRSAILTPQNKKKDREMMSGISVFN